MDPKERAEVEPLATDNQIAETQDAANESALEQEMDADGDDDEDE